MSFHSPDSLSRPVGYFVRPGLSLPAETSLAKALTDVIQYRATIIPITVEDHYIGVLTPRTVRYAVAGDYLGETEIGKLSESWPSIKPYVTAAEALREFDRLDIDTLVVVDDNGIVHGVVQSLDFIRIAEERPKPPVIGGMATPFGVYLSSGNIRAGAGDLALMATGATLFILLTLATMLSNAIWILLPDANREPWLIFTVDQALPVLFFLSLLRLIPLSGTHGAEHQTVTAIERNELLVPAVVSRMPRVHPRCGTNLAVAVSLFLGLQNLPFIADKDLSLLIALLGTLFFWKPIGTALQQFVTTKTPTAAQLAGGIAAGEQLLERYASAGHRQVPFHTRVWNMGLIQVIAGSSITLALIGFVVQIFGLGWLIPI